MRTTTSLAASLLVALAISGSVGAWAGPTLPVDPTSISPGPFAGAVFPGGTAMHHYQNAPDGAICVAMVQPYMVLVESSGPVTVSAGGESATITGSGSLHFWSGVCTSFDITVTGMGGLPAAYAIEVAAPAVAVGLDDVVITGP